MSEPSNVPISVEFRDQRPGLVAFGIVAIVLGGLCALITLLQSLAVILVSRAGTGLEWRRIVLGIAVYAILSMILVWLGIGSILCRRWARALLLILSWSVLLAGVITMCFFVIFSRLLFAAAMGTDSRAVSVTVAVMQTFIAVFAVLLPGAMVLFYSRRNVKATCEARDPVIRWTDTCPLPVLAASLWFAVGALRLLAMPLTSGSVLPLFGVLVSGTKATVVIVAVSVIWLYLAWATYRLKIAGWWTALVVFAFFSMSATVTFLKVNLMELYRRLGYPEAQIEQIRRSLSFLTGKTLMWWMVSFFLLALIYLLWIKKYFRAAPGDTSAAAPAQTPNTP
jgi:hypothetical protein